MWKKNENIKENYGSCVEAVHVSKILMNCMREVYPEFDLSLFVDCALHQHCISLGLISYKVK